MSTPKIQTAIPKRRYQLGEFVLTVLGEVESGDATRYRYILAVTREGEGEPKLYVSAERAGSEDALRVSMAEGSQVIATSDRWRDLDTFVQDGMSVVSKMLSLSDEIPHRLM